MPVLIGIAGGSGAGRKEICLKIQEKLAKESRSKDFNVQILCLRDFHKSFNLDFVGVLPPSEVDRYPNLEHPDAFEFDLLSQVLLKIKRGDSDVELPVFDFINLKRKEETIKVGEKVPDVILLEGILSLFDAKVREMLNLRIFIDVDSDLRLARRVSQLSLQESKRNPQHSLEWTLQYYLKYVKPSYQDYIDSTRTFADIIIPRGPENSVAVEIIMQHIQDTLLNPTTIITNSTQERRLRGKSFGGDEEVSGFAAIPN